MPLSIPRVDGWRICRQALVGHGSPAARGALRQTMNILGISAFYHDSAACLLRDGVIVAAAQEERFSRRKHDPDFPEQAIAFCLKQAGLRTTDLEAVAFYDKPMLKFERILQTHLGAAPTGLAAFVKAVPLWLKEKLWIRDRIQSSLSYQGPILFPEHHESHAAAAFFPSPYGEAAILTMDGVGEWATTSLGIGSGNRVRLLSDIAFPHSLGLLYSAFAQYCGFRINDGEYKLMGLAPYGRAVFVNRILEELIEVKADGSFRLNLAYFDYCGGLAMINQRFEKLFGGPAREPESALDSRFMDAARSIQEVTEMIVLRLAAQARRETGLPNLCLAGGVALNCVANGKLLKSGLFERVWVQPAAGDAGGAVGAAFLAWHHYFDAVREAPRGQDAMQGALLGDAYADDALREVLSQHSVPYRELGGPALAETVADLLADGRVVGWFQGRMEFGPRALGNRSILADARSPGMRERINSTVKMREDFRPFAPAVPAGVVSEYFELGCASPYMLFVAPVAEAHRRALSEADGRLEGLDQGRVVRSDIPAVTHVDHSARIQTVSEPDNPRFYALLEALQKRHGCPVVVNTSFNVRGEPIVRTPQEALRCFAASAGMDALALGPFLVQRLDLAPESLLRLASIDVASAARRPTGPADGELRRFGLGLALGCAIWSGIALWRGFSWWWLLTVLALCLGLAGLTRQPLLRRLERLFAAVSATVAQGLSTVLLTVIFVFVVVPIAMLGRLFGVAFLERRFRDDAVTYWQARSPLPSAPESYERQF